MKEQEVRCSECQSTNITRGEQDQRQFIAKVVDVEEKVSVPDCHEYVCDKGHHFQCDAGRSIS